MKPLAVVMLAAGVVLCFIGWGLSALALDVLLEDPPALAPPRRDGEAWPDGMRGW